MSVMLQGGFSANKPPKIGETKITDFYFIMIIRMILSTTAPSMTIGTHFICGFVLHIGHMTVLT